MTRPRLHLYTGVNKQALVTALRSRDDQASGTSRLVVVAAGEAELTERATEAIRWLTGGGPLPDGIFYRDEPLHGGTAFVYPSGSTAYPGMGKELMTAFPAIADSVARRCGRLACLAGRTDGHVLGQVWGTLLLSLLHTEISTTVLGLCPRAALGYSQGETTAVIALGVWSDIAEFVEEVTTSDLFTHEITGKFAAPRRAWRDAGLPGEHWTSHLVSGDLDQVTAELATEPAVHLQAVNAPGLCVIGGEAQACGRIAERLNRTHIVMPIPYAMAVHAPDIRATRRQWWRLFHRPCQDPGIRLHSCVTGDWYRPTDDTVAHALTEQATKQIDFPRAVERAYADGTRVFVEHGPAGQCTDWIRRILHDRPHLAVALDSPRTADLDHLIRTAADLLAAGLPIDPDPLRPKG